MNLSGARIPLNCDFGRLVKLLDDEEVWMTLHDTRNVWILVSGEDNESARIRAD